jgi:hypothetical protein
MFHLYGSSSPLILSNLKAASFVVTVYERPFPLAMHFALRHALRDLAQDEVS